MRDLKNVGEKDVRNPAIAMAIRASVTVSMAELTSGTLSRILRVN